MRRARSLVPLLALLLSGAGQAGGGQATLSVATLSVRYVASTPAGGHVQEFAVQGREVTFYVYDRRLRVGRSGRFRGWPCGPP